MVAYTEVSFQPNFAEAQAACVKCHERSFTTVDKEIIPRAVITHLLSKKKNVKKKQFKIEGPTTQIKGQLLQIFIISVHVNSFRNKRLPGRQGECKNRRLSITGPFIEYDFNFWETI